MKNLADLSIFMSDEVRPNGLNPVPKLHGGVNFMALDIQEALTLVRYI
jgi:hypothetical protein